MISARHALRQSLRFAPAAPLRCKRG